MNPLVELQKYGQSFWYDNISRKLITSGELKRMIEQDGLRGMTSNPTIFEKAIGGSSDYDDQLRDLVARELSVQDIYENVVIRDIQAATDHFRPLYDRENGNDGYVCLEVAPDLAHNTEATIAQAEHLWRRVNRPNVMIKVPATPAGIPAIEHLIATGLNINVTLMFAPESYEQVAEAYIRGLEKLANEGRQITQTASVASLFVSRVDTAVDKLLDKMKAPADLLGKAAIANSRLLYQQYKEIFHGPRFADLRAKAARPQRLLWASTSTKNPQYVDVMYAEALIGPETVDTMPDATIQAFRDHGRVRLTLEEGLDDALRTLDRLKQLGIDMRQVMQQLQDDGVRLFADSFDKLMETLEKKRDAIQKELASSAFGHSSSEKIHDFGRYNETLRLRLENVEQRQIARRLLDRDPTLWKNDAEAGDKIRKRLGWLNSPAEFIDKVDEIRAFAGEVRKADIKHALLLGMGGSSLCPEVCRNTFGVAPGYIDLRVLDTTDPAAIASAERSIDLAKTLFINASKSGTTIESASLARYFWEKAPRGSQFVAITDAGTVLDKEGEAREFRRVFRNPEDIGGRYSALSYFGLVPAALIGADINSLLERAERMAGACATTAPTRGNPGISLGAMLGELAAQNRDKVTFVLSDSIRDFGNWVEQLIAESTGKEGKGLVPVVGEPLGLPEVYGPDRVFVAMLVEGDDNGAIEKRLRTLESAGHPVYRLALKERLDLGGEFYRWEVATAVAGAVMGINPFDEPNVTESKENTTRLLAQFEKEKRLPDTSAGRADDLPKLLEQARAADYISILAFLQPKPETVARLATLREQLRDSTRLATTVGFGPRYLHSTGQLHKGGPNTGLFLFLTADDAADLPIPGRPYGFSILKQAQALGDLLALKRRGRRVLHVHLGSDVKAAIEALAGAIAVTARATR